PSNRELFSCSRTCNCSFDRVASNSASLSYTLDTFAPEEGPLDGLVAILQLTHTKGWGVLPLALLYFSLKAYFLLISLYVRRLLKFLTQIPRHNPSMRRKKCIPSLLLLRRHQPIQKPTL